MFIAIVKLLDILARALFVVGATYTLPLEAAGQFGMVVTITGLFAFVIGWERYIDLQRRMVGETEAVFDRQLADAIVFYGFNYLVFLPLFVFSIWGWAHFGWATLGLTVLILVGEQLGNQSYQIALVNPRYRGLLWIFVARSLVLFGLLVQAVMAGEWESDLLYLLRCWALVSVVSALLISYFWSRMTTHAPHATAFAFKERITAQHKASMTHFLIGLLAVLALQFDRLAVGGLLTFREVGIYFRHVLIASFLLQFFNIASYNRMMPAIFALAKTEAKRAQFDRILPEIAKVLGASLAGVGALYALDRMTEGAVFARYALEWPLILFLLAAVFVRTLGDYGALILHSRHREKLVLMAQASAFVIGGILLVMLTLRFHALGAALATLFTAMLYAALSIRAAIKIPEKQADA